MYYDDDKTQPQNQNTPVEQDAPVERNTPFAQNAPLEQSMPFEQNTPFGQPAPVEQHAYPEQNMPLGQNTQVPYNHYGQDNFYHQRYAQPPTPPEPEKPRQKMAPRYIAAALALSLAAGGAGGGITYLMMRESGNAPVSAPSVTIQEAKQDGVPIAASVGSDVSAIVKKAASSVVEITTGSITRDRFIGEFVTEGAGSGVIVSEDGYIVTNNHVVRDTSSITVRTLDGSEYEAELIGVDSKTDLALVKIEATGLSPVTFADSDAIEVGELAVAIGNPLGTLGGTVTNGIISAKDREIKIDNYTMALLQTSAAVNPGNSGGGLFNASGNLVGVVNAKSAGLDIEGLGFAIPSNIVKEVVNELITNGYVSGRPQLGISVIEISDPLTAAMYRFNGMGVYIADVLVEESGLLKGDRLSSIDGREILTTSDIAAILSEHKVGDTLSVKIFRDGHETEVSVTLTEQVPENMRTTPSVKSDA